MGASIEIISALDIHEESDKAISINTLSVVQAIGTNLITIIAPVLEDLFASKITSCRMCNGLCIVVVFDGATYGCNSISIA